MVILANFNTYERTCHGILAMANNKQNYIDPKDSAVAHIGIFSIEPTTHEESL